MNINRSLTNSTDLTTETIIISKSWGKLFKLQFLRTCVKYTHTVIERQIIFSIVEENEECIFRNDTIRKYNDKIRCKVRINARKLKMLTKNTGCEYVDLLGGRENFLHDSIYIDNKINFYRNVHSFSRDKFIKKVNRGDLLNMCKLFQFSLIGPVLN